MTPKFVQCTLLTFFAIASTNLLSNSLYIKSIESNNDNYSDYLSKPLHTITIQAAGGSGHYKYKINNGSPQASNIFRFVPAGVHKITVQDSQKGETAPAFIGFSDETLKINKIETVPCSSLSKNDGIIIIQAQANDPIIYSILKEGDDTPVIQVNNGHFYDVEPGNYFIRISAYNAQDQLAGIRMVVSQTEKTHNSSIVNTDAFWWFKPTESPHAH